MSEERKHTSKRENERPFLLKQSAWRVVNALATRLEFLKVDELTPTERADHKVKIFIESTLVARAFGRALGEKGNALAIQAFYNARQAINELDKASERDYLLRTLVEAARGCGVSDERGRNEVDEALDEISNEYERQAALKARADALTKRLWRDFVYNSYALDAELERFGLENYADSAETLSEESLAVIGATLDLNAVRQKYFTAFDRACRVVDELEYQNEYDLARVKLLAIDRIYSALFRCFGQELRDAYSGSILDDDEPSSYTAKLELYDGEFARYAVVGGLDESTERELYARATRALEDLSVRLTTREDENGDPLAENELDALRLEARSVAIYSSQGILDGERLRRLCRNLDAFEIIDGQILALRFHLVTDGDLDSELVKAELSQWRALGRDLMDGGSSASERSRRALLLAGTCCGLPSYRTLSAFGLPRNYNFTDASDLVSASDAFFFMSEAKAALDEIEEPLARCERCAEYLELQLRLHNLTLARSAAERWKSELLALDSDLEREFVILQFSRLFAYKPVADALRELLASSARLAPLRAFVDFRQFYRAARRDLRVEEIDLRASELIERTLAALRNDEEPTVEAERIIELTRALVKSCRRALRNPPHFEIGDELV